MYKIGYSVYLSNFSKVKQKLPSLYSDGSYVFISMHIAEEMDEHYLDDIRDMTGYIRDIGFRIICDVSRHTFDFLDYDSLAELRNDLGIDMLRIDYGFSIEEINLMLEQMPLCLNASTVSAEELESLNGSDNEVLFMHNFYPHTDTGLDRNSYLKINSMIESYGYKTISFISSDINLRGPVYDGLVTLEKHRFKSPYFQALDYYLNYGQEIVFVGDSILSDESNEKILDFIGNGVIELPVSVEEEYNYICDRIFTIRRDSPEGLKRLQESREYSRAGQAVKPCNTVARTAGSITVDNELYKRYSGEVMICKEDYRPDRRVNVAGRLCDPEMLELLDNRRKIRFVYRKD